MVEEEEKMHLLHHQQCWTVCAYYIQWTYEQTCTVMVGVGRIRCLPNVPYNRGFYWPLEGMLVMRPMCQWACSSGRNKDNTFALISALLCSKAFVGCTFIILYYRIWDIHNAKVGFVYFARWLLVMYGPLVGCLVGTSLRAIITDRCQSMLGPNTVPVQHTQTTTVPHTDLAIPSMHIITKKAITLLELLNLA